MTRFIMILTAAAGLAACQPSVPDSGARLSNGAVNPGRGVGFENSIAQERARQAAALQAAPQVSASALPPSTAGPTSALAQTQPAPAGQVRRAAPTSAAPVRTAAATATTAVAGSGPNDPELRQIAARNDALAAASNSGQQVVNASPSNAPPPIINNPGISNETDFNAVSARRSIQGDAALRAQNQAQYQVVQPTALPSRASTGPNVVRYALQTRHPVGQRVYRRVSVASPARVQRNCAEYVSADDAQAAFLSRGGPQRDRLNLDPDGDGYACGWNPAPFRRAAGQ